MDKIRKQNMEIEEYALQMPANGKEVVNETDRLFAELLIRYYFSRNSLDNESKL